MSPEKQRIAIAEACPDTFRVHDDGIYFLLNGRFVMWTEDNGLVAMHEAEKVLTAEQWNTYVNYTYGIACYVEKETSDFRWISLTAAQRCEAFLKTLNLWEDES